MIEETIKLRINPTEDEVAPLGSQLNAYNRSQVFQSSPCHVLLSVNDDPGELVAGLYGRVSYSWLFIELLWVAATERGRGLGSRMLHGAEEYALERGCHSAWLDTFGFQARGFYEKQGYTVFGELPNYPGEHSRYFLSKKLALAPVKTVKA